MAGLAPLLHVNPPFDQMGRMLRKVLEATELPAHCFSTAAQLAGLPHVLPIRARWLLHHIADLCIPGPMVPNTSIHCPMATRYGIEALYMAWR